MKTPATVTVDIERYVKRGWHLDAAGTGEQRWPKQFPLGTVTSADADQRWAEVRDWSHNWHDWANQHHVTLRMTGRRLRGTLQQLPTHVQVNDPHTAATIAGKRWAATFSTGRGRAELIRTTFPQAPAAEAILLAASLNDLDFTLACTAATWFITNSGNWDGLTPRQVPVEGLHGKWLNNHRAIVDTLTGGPITLAKRPTRVHWTYLDPAYRLSGARVHDSLTLTDNVTLPYTPRTVIIVENKDTAVLFPPLPAAVCVEGNGNAAPGLLPAISWVIEAERVIYWGDIDASGYEILDRLRQRIPHAASILMDEDAYQRYERYGTNTDERGNPLAVRARKACPNLTAEERVVYEHLTDPNWLQNRRVEQERIPLGTAAHYIARLLNG